MVDVKKERNMQSIFNNKSGLNVSWGTINLSGKYTDKVIFRIISHQKIDEQGIKKVTKIIIDIEEYANKLKEFNIEDKLINKLEHKYKKYNNWKYDNEAGHIVFEYNDTEFITSTKLAIKYERETMKILRAFNAVIAYLEKIISNKEERAKMIAAKKAANKAIANEAASAVPGASLSDEEQPRGFYEVTDEPVSI